MFSLLQGSVFIFPCGIQLAHCYCTALPKQENDKNNFSNQNKDILLVRICFRYRSKLSHQLTRIALMIAKKLTSHNQQLKREHV